MTNESKDRQALRIVATQTQPMAYGTDTPAFRLRLATLHGMATEALAKPDPCAALADALRWTATCLEKSGPHMDRQAAIERARAALAAYESSKE